MDTENKAKYDEVIDEFKSRIGQIEFDFTGEHCVKPSELFAHSSYSEMFLEVTKKRPMISAGEVSDLLKTIREKMGDEVEKRTLIIFELLGSDIEKQEENFLKLSWHQRWLLKGYLLASAALEYCAFGISKMYKKVVKWIKDMNDKVGVGMDIIQLPDELPSMDTALDWLEQKFDLEKQFAGMFNPR